MSPVSDSDSVVTTVIPTFRRPALLRRAIRSVLGQTYPHVEVRVYDNCSGDDTAEVVEECSRKDSRVRYQCRPRNLGPMANIAEGMADVRTPFFSVLSDDDLLLPRCYERALAAFNRFPQAKFSCTAVLHFHERYGIVGSPGFGWPEGLHVPPHGVKEMIKYSHPTWNGTVFRREVLEEVGSLDLETGLIGDLDFELRAASRFPFVTSRFPGGVYYIHAGAASFTGNIPPGWSTWSRLIQKTCDLPGAVGHPEVRRGLERRARRWLLHKGLASVRQGDADGVAAVLRLLAAGWSRFPAALFKLAAAGALRSPVLFSRLMNSAQYLREAIIRGQQPIPTEEVLQELRNLEHSLAS